MDYSLTTYDRILTAKCVFTVLPTGATINFQFPPRITNESNNSEWETKDVWSIEQLKIHKGSGGRKLNMEWDYVCTDSTWNPTKISETLRLLKAYFFEYKKEFYPVVLIQYTEVIPIPTQFRLMSCQIDYSPEIATSGGASHPLITKVGVSLEVATTVSGNKGAGSDKLKQKPLRACDPRWY